MNYPGFVFRTLHNEGYSPRALLSKTGLNEDHLRDPHFRCGFPPLRRLFLNAIEQTQNSNLGVTLALKFEPTYIGLPAYTAMNAACLRDGLKVLERFFSLTFPALDFSLVDMRSDEAAIRLRSKFTFSGIEYFAFSSAIVATNGLLKAMLRTEKVAIRAETTVCPPAGWDVIATTVGFPVRFEAAENHIVFPEALLDHPLPGADPINHARLLALCEQHAAQMSYARTPITQVRAILDRASNLTASLADVATELGYSERGMRRQLERSGTTYRKLLDQIREQRARELLSGSKRPIKTIAYMLGFESSSNFSRSFNRWTGITPKAFRDQARTQAEDDTGRK